MLNMPSAQPILKSRYSGLAQSGTLRADVGLGEANSLYVPADTIVYITQIDGGESAWLTTLPDDAQSFGVAAMDVSSDLAQPLDDHSFDARTMRDLVSARDGTLGNAKAIRIFDETTDAGDVFILRMRDAARLFVIAPLAPGFIEHGGGGAFRVEAKLPANHSVDLVLPDPLGNIVDEWRVSRGTAKAYAVKKGQFLQVIDVEG